MYLQKFVGRLFFWYEFYKWFTQYALFCNVRFKIQQYVLAIRSHSLCEVSVVFYGSLLATIYPF